MFEATEENPMLGRRGASRYYHPAYKEGFLLEVAAVRRVRETMGLTNLKVMIPFCRTPREAVDVLAVMREGGLERGVNGLEVYVMAEIPSNVILAERFAELFDGFSIGSNDLTQLILGVDRDSTQVAALSTSETTRCAGRARTCWKPHTEPVVPSGSVGKPRRTILTSPLSSSSTALTPSASMPTRSCERNDVLPR